MKSIHPQHGESLTPAKAYQKRPLTDFNLKKQSNMQDASIIAKVHPTQHVLRLVEELRNHPDSVPVRLELISIIINLKKVFPLPFYKNLLIQSLIPLYLGQYDMETLACFARSYHLYLRKLEEYIKSSLEGLRSFQRGADDNNNADDSTAAHYSEEQQLLSAIEIIKTLLVDARKFKKLIRQSISFSFNTEELEKPDDQERGKEKAISFYLYPDSLLLEKTTTVLDLIKNIPLLHPLGLQISKKIQKNESWKGIAQLYERRIQMKMLHSYIRRVEAGDLFPEKKIFSTFRKVVSGYRKIKEILKKRGIEAKEYFFLLEFADVISAVYLYRDLLNLEDTEILKLLKEGQQALSMAMMDAPELTNKYRRLERALHSLYP
ncbi:MAG: hypothetical protein HQM14_12950 [SAR324 cluster bacterium]|nr:hypothetical protein [SAR324 cluster bacterium]